MEELYNKHIQLIEKNSETYPNLTNLWKNIVSVRKDNYESLLKESIDTLEKVKTLKQDITDKDLMTFFILFNSKGLNITD
tara:strand:- start:1266 stop:1505 length:240 start_codon:yes stop_codon:yes gene_type:complete